MAYTYLSSLEIYLQAKKQKDTDKNLRSFMSQNTVNNHVVMYLLKSIIVVFQLDIEN